mmetsp:Transcript_23668/g.41926  ORF Transcript_23668/g.41926 Transcript_23668/m.41926 type:complete len:141 (+) Transcript_23668:1812-2234(+)
MIWLLLTTVLACVEYEENDPPLYCEDIITWDVSPDVWKTRFERNNQALQYYYYMRDRYNSDEENKPSKDCLAIAREFFCSYTFPYCDSEDDPERGVCDFLCDIFEDRCPDEDSSVFCDTSESSQCSSAIALAVVALSWLL